MLSLPALLLCLTLGADDTAPLAGPALWSPPPSLLSAGDGSSADERRNWMLGGALAWAPIGASMGGLMGLAAFGLDSREALRVGVGTAVGALVGVGLGAVLGWSASQGSEGSRLAVLIPAALQRLGALVAASWVVYQARDSR